VVVRGGGGGGGGGVRAGVEVLMKGKISCPCWDANSDFSDIQPVPKSIYELS